MDPRNQLLSIRERLEILRNDVDNLVSELYPQVIKVPVGSNLLSLIDSAPESSLFDLEFGFAQDIGLYKFKKPCKIFGSINMLFGEISIEAPDVSFDTISITGLPSRNTILSIPSSGKRASLNNCRLTGHPNGQHRGIAANAEGIRLLNTNVINIAKDIDTQAVGGWVGTKDLIIRGGVYEATGENIMFGGGATGSESMIPTDILIENVELTKDVIWRQKPYLACKNLFEIKNGRNITLRKSKLRQSWQDDQVGAAMLFTVRNPTNAEPWSIIDNILIEGNEIEMVGAGVQISGRDGSATGIRETGGTHRISMVNNKWRNVNPELQKSATGQWASGRLYQITSGATNITIDGDQFHECKNIAGALYFEFPEIKNLVVKNARLYEGEYGIHGSKAQIGKSVLDMYAPGYVWENVIMVRTKPKNIPYPIGTTIVSE